MLSVGGVASGQTIRSAPGGGRVLVELLDEASALDHTPVELLIDSKFLVGSAVRPFNQLNWLPSTVTAAYYSPPPLQFPPRVSGAPTIGTVQLGKGERGSTFCDQTGT